MATKKKAEETIQEVEETVNETPVYVPDVPAQMIEEEPAKETEVEFLKRLLAIQHTGGFGRHLDDVINKRIKLLL